MFNIFEDLSAFVKKGGNVEKLKCVLISHAFHLVVLYRIGCYFSKTPIFGGIIRVILEYLIRVLYSSDISLRSEIGPGLVIVHGHDIVIGESVRIGKYCKILNGVTLGNKDTETEINHQPIAGNNVVIGSGAKILGGIQIGDNVKIGANSVVLTSVPSNVVVAGIPAKIVKSQNLPEHDCVRCTN